MSNGRADTGTSKVECRHNRSLPTKLARTPLLAAIIKAEGRDDDAENKKQRQHQLVHNNIITIETQQLIDE